MQIKALAVAALILLSNVVATDAVSQTTGQWLSECEVDRMTDKKECAVVVVIDPRGRPEELLAVVVAVASGTVGVLGPRYGSGARVRVDGNPAVAMSGCERSVCVLRPQQAKTVISQMRNGSNMLVEFTTVHGERIGPFDVGLSGFDAQYQNAAAGFGMRR
ncbi:MAG: invasion associated locus B family protein [Proteobacteria bacterium]|nr:invasion associated locus B family protein [Pseudomonadota bacterium]